MSFDSKRDRSDPVGHSTVLLFAGLPARHRIFYSLAGGLRSRPGRDVRNYPCASGIGYCLCYTFPVFTFFMLTTLSSIKRKAIPILRRAGIRKTVLFGSQARGDANEKSDIDFLVHFKRNATLLDLIDLRQNLEDAFQRRVDLVTPGSTQPFLKKEIQKCSVQIL